MIIPPGVHHRRGRGRAGTPGRPPTPRQPAGAVAAVGATALAGVVIAALQDGVLHDISGRTALAALSVAAAAIVGFVVARVIGRQGRL